MGNERSKVQIHDEKGESNVEYESNSAPRYQTDDNDELTLLKRTIRKDPDSFILNNLMMCVQFFENYEEDIIQVKETLASSHENKLNKLLLPQKHILMPDVLQQHIARKVTFISTRQTSYPIIEPLQSIRVYVVHDNIEITEQHYLPEYSSVNNAVTYSMLLKPSERQGYVWLELLDETPLLTNSTKNENTDPSTDNDDEIFSDGDSIYVSKSNLKTFPPQRIERNDLLTSEIFNAISLPNPQNDKIIYEDRACCSHEDTCRIHCSRDTKTESDYEYISWTAENRRRNHGKRIWSRCELTAMAESHQQHLLSDAEKSKKTKSHSPASSTSSGYRSGHYRVDSDSDGSCYIMHSANVASSSNVDRDVTTTYETPFCNTPLCEIPLCGTPLSDILLNDTLETTKTSASTEIYSTSNARIPRQCFKQVTHTRQRKIYDPRKDQKELQNSKQRRLRTAIRRFDYEVSYISSKEFISYFDKLFHNHLGQSLGFDQEDLDDAKSDGSVIYCDKFKLSPSSKLCKIESHEIVPTIWLQWPECAQEWLVRPRSWPSCNDVNKVKDSGCYVIPEAYRSQNDCNIHQEFEWQLTFPAAERYLETCMTHSQTQVYLIALMLHKTFIRPIFDTMYGLTTSHIRSKMFRLIEEDNSPSKWPDNRTGECLLKLLYSLYRCLSQNKPTLLDYFVFDKNVFQGVPYNHLLHTQKQLKRILDNPIMYLFHAMENIWYSEKFFPRLDYETLLKLLTVDSLVLLNPALEQRMWVNEEMCVMRDEISNKPDAFWDNAKMQSKRNEYNIRVVTNKTLINPRKATDSIIEISVRCAELDGPRLGALLDFFAKHFVKMAERCHQYRAYRQKKIYLDQADRLSIILSELIWYKDDAKAHRDNIDVLRIKMKDPKSPNTPPETPKRNLEAPLFSDSLKNRFAANNSVDVSTELENEQVNLAKSSKDDEGGKVIVTKAIVHEVQFKKEENEQVKANIFTPEKSISIDRSDDFEMIEKVAPLAANQNNPFLTQTTYI